MKYSEWNYTEYILVWSVVRVVEKCKKYLKHFFLPICFSLSLTFFNIHVLFSVIV